MLTLGKNVKRYKFGALHARTGRIIYGVTERKNAEEFTQLPDFLNSRYQRAKRIHLVLDNYSIHKARRVVRQPAARGTCIAFHFLPPYSPNDNVIDRLWKQPPSDMATERG